MARPEEPVKPGPFEEFARDLRALRADTELTYRQLAHRANYSPSALSSAASGASLPTLELTLAFVRACGGDVEAWRARWHRLAASQHLAVSGEPAASEDEAEPAVPPDGPAAPEKRRASLPGGGWPVRVKIGVIPLALAAVIVVVVLVALDRGGGGPSPSAAATPPTWVAYAGPDCLSANDSIGFSLYNDPTWNQKWQQAAVGSPGGFQGCGHPLYTPQAGQGDQWNNDADWVFKPGPRVNKCHFEIYVPPGQWAASVLYNVYPGDASNGYKGDRTATFHIDQATYDAGGGWAVSRQVSFSTGTVDLSITDASASGGANVVADVVRAICS